MGGQAKLSTAPSKACNCKVRISFQGTESNKATNMVTWGRQSMFGGIAGCPEVSRKRMLVWKPKPRGVGVEKNHAVF